MTNLIENSGKYRTKGVGIVKGSKVEHIALPYQNVPFLIKDLFQYLKDKSEISLIKSCVFRDEMEFIHPFMDCNGRMGRLWQTVILMDECAVFEYLPFETLLSKNQTEYYNSISILDKEWKSTEFIEYLLNIIDQCLSELLENSIKKLSDEDRIQIFIEIFTKEFTRKDYLIYFKNILSDTASRDLRKAVENEILSKQGDKKTTTYKKN